MGATEIVAVVGCELDEYSTVAEFLEIPELIRVEGPVHITLLALDDRQRKRAGRIRQALGREDVTRATGGALSLRIVGPGAGVSSIAELVGDRPDLLGDRGDSPDDLEPVLFNAMSGPEEQRAQLEVLLDGYELRSIHRSAGGSVYVTKRQALRRSHLISALHFVRTADGGEESHTRVDAERFHGLIVGTGEPEPGKAFRETAALLGLVGSERLKVQPDYHSASADLLDRLGDHERAAELRRLIRLWLTNRLWSGNLVPEMVLHDEDHAVAVDRNVAFICEPLVSVFDPKNNDPGAGGTDRLTTEDLFVLAAAAWLHDCGHSSARVGTQFEIGAITVRELHGYLSYLRLTEANFELHGLANRVVKRDTRDDGVRSRTRSRIRLLCAHHQGKSSFDHIPGKLKRPRGWGHDPAVSFLNHVEKDLSLRGRSESAQKGAFELLSRMLAVLRVADAADVGVHRVPDFTSRRVNHEPVVFRVIDELVRSVSLAEKVGAAMGADSYERNMSSTVEDQFRHYGDLVRLIADEWRWSETEVTAVVESFEEEEKLGEYSEGSSTEGLGLITDLAKKRAWEYARHVAMQSGFYSSHSRYEIVFPFLRWDVDRWRLSLAAMPSRELKNRGEQLAHHSEEAASMTHSQRAQEYLLDIVVREFGSRTQTKGFVQSETDKIKTQVPLRLNDLLIDAQTPEFTWIGAVTKMARPVGPELEPLKTAPLAQGLGVVMQDEDIFMVLTADRDGAVCASWNSNETGQTPLCASPYGDRIVTLRERHLAFHAVAADGEVRETGHIAPIPPGGRLLAAGQDVASAGPVTALISWPNATGTVDEAGNRTRIMTQGCVAGVIVRGHVIAVDTSGAAHAHLVGSDGAPSVVPWLEGVRVIDLDAVVIEGRALVVALGEQDGVLDVAFAELHEDGTWEQRTGHWEQSRPQQTFSGANGVVLVRRTHQALVALVIRDRQRNEVLTDSAVAPPSEGGAPQ